MSCLAVVIYLVLRSPFVFLASAMIVLVFLDIVPIPVFLFLSTSVEGFTKWPKASVYLALSSSRASSSSISTSISSSFSKWGGLKSTTPLRRAMIASDSLHSSNLSLPYKYLGDSGMEKQKNADTKFMMTPKAKK